MIILGTGERCLVLGAIDSTNEEARRLARMGEAGPLWIRAERQNKGRGRRGRAWVSEPGNLYATCLLATDAPLSTRSELSFVAALALHDALTQFPEDDPRLRCKWPNDLLFDRQKVAGILLESEADWLAIGFGVNLVHHPRDVERPATSVLAARGISVEPQEMLEALAAAFLLRCSIWRRDGFRSIRADWLDRAAGLGERVTARLGTENRNGIFSGITDRGALVLETDDGSRVEIQAGDVFFGDEGGLSHAADD